MVVTMREMGVVKARTITEATEVAAAMALAMESMGWGKDTGKSVWHHVFVVGFPCCRARSL
jgi:hypothetical protein